MSKQAKEVSTEEAMKVLQKRQQAKRDACAKEIAAVCNKYGFTLQVGQTIELVQR